MWNFTQILAETWHFMEKPHKISAPSHRHENKPAETGHFMILSTATATESSNKEENKGLESNR